MQGKILTSRYGVYTVFAEGQVRECKPRGILRLQGQKPSVGDEAEIDPIDLTITHLLPRKNVLIRPLIANLDLLIIVHSVVEPAFSSLLIDKFLTYARHQSIPPHVILTKVDRLKDRSQLFLSIQRLEKLGVKVTLFSKKTGEGLQEVKELLSGRVSALMGQTGVGKSSLLNTVAPDFQRQIGEYSQALGRGKHQTKEVILLPFGSGFVADTPGFSSLELDMTKEDVAHDFPGIGELALQCKYANCLHQDEKDCAVKKAIQEGRIDVENYENYLKLINELPFRKTRY